MNMLPLTPGELARSVIKNTNTEDDGASILPIPDGIDLKTISDNSKMITPYRDMSGKVLFYVARYQKTNDRKIDIPYCWWKFSDGREEWKCKQPLECNRPLLNLPNIIKQSDKPVYVGEGEKVAAALHKFFPGVVATTSSGGANAAPKTDWSALSSRDVVLFLDNDPAGANYGREVYKLCQQAGARSIKLFRTEIFAQYTIEDGQIIERTRELPDGYDLADAQEEGWTADLLSGFEKTTGVPLFVEYENIFPASGNECPDTKTFQRLAAYSLIEYERARKDEAKRLNVNVSALDHEVKKWRTQNSNEEKKELLDIFPTIEPWPDPICIDEILTEITTLFNRFAILPAHADTALALWVTFTWCIEYVDVAPILTLSSPEKQCGKTTVLSIIGKLALKPLPASNISAAALFRAIEKWQPTLIIDEADTFISASHELRGVINSGHARPTAYVIRTVGEDHTPKQFSTWGAKVIALIGKLPDTLHDRSLVIELQRKHTNEKTEKLRHVDQQIFADLRHKLLRFSQDNGHLIKGACPNLPTNISDRAADNWEPLLAIAGLAGQSWIDRAQKAAAFLSNRVKDSVSLGNQLLFNIQQIFQRNGVEKLSTAALIEGLCNDDELRWLTYNAGKPITPKQIAALLNVYKIHSKSIKFENDTVLRGFEKSQFEDVWNRYLSPGPSENAATPLPILLLSK